MLEAAGIEMALDNRVEVVDLDRVLINWTSIDDSGRVLLRFNIDDQHVYMRGMAERLVLHD